MIHPYKMNGYNIVLDANSGCVHTVDDVAYDIIQLYGKTPIQELTSIITRRHGITENEVQEVIDD
ncbi:thioether cross-link-forming SCIFF peptide maturase, partial [Intestinibacillus massiliensis]|nr:thioether cross-link-forming SCIFF peptide maturase [Intestinibacillus massiliensis]